MPAAGINSPSVLFFLIPSYIPAYIYIFNTLDLVLLFLSYYYIYVMSLRGRRERSSEKILPLFHVSRRRRRVFFSLSPAIAFVCQPILRVLFAQLYIIYFIIGYFFPAPLFTFPHVMFPFSTSQ